MLYHVVIKTTIKNYNKLTFTKTYQNNPFSCSIFAIVKIIEKIIIVRGEEDAEI